MHLEVSSDLLFRHFGSLLCFNISSFSSKHNWHTEEVGLHDGAVVTICHFTSGSGFAGEIFWLVLQMCCESVVAFLLFSFLKLCLCLVYRSLKLVSAIPM